MVLTFCKVVRRTGLLTYELATFSGISNEEGLALDTGGTVSRIQKYYGEYKSKAKS